MNVPKLPDLSVEIFVDRQGDELTVNDEEMTVRVHEGTHKSEIQSKRKNNNLGPKIANCVFESLCPGPS